MSPGDPIRQSAFRKGSSKAKLYLAERYQAPQGITAELRRGYLKCCFEYEFYCENPREAKKYFDQWCLLGGKASLKDWVKRWCSGLPVTYGLVRKMLKFRARY